VIQNVKRKGKKRTDGRKKKIETSNKYSQAIERETMPPMGAQRKK